MAPDQHLAEHAEAGRKPCPICGKPSTLAAAPFCSKRCADVDLHRWLGGVYAVPTDETDQDDADS